MAIVAPKARKHLSADALAGLVHNGLAHIPDARRLAGCCLTGSEFMKQISRPSSFVFIQRRED
jgi:hypothetical protein